jgi:hypothetical protein
MQAYREDRLGLRKTAGELPEGLDWERLAAEMTANIRVGLAAGECVAPRTRRRLTLNWRPAAVSVGLVLVLTAAWWLNVPASDTQTVGRAVRSLFQNGREGTLRPERGPVVEASSEGIELRENGSALGLAQRGLSPLTVSVSIEGSASARYIDDDTGQVTITSVYVQ